MLRIWIKEGRAFREVDNGPFPLTGEQLAKARAQFAAERSKASALGGANHAPQTTARDILKQICPALPDFDCLMIGFAVTSERVKWEQA